MQQWEHLVVYIEAQMANDAATEMGAREYLNADKFTDVLNQHAAAGWELMQFEWDGSRGARARFRRPRA